VIEALIVIGGVIGVAAVGLFVSGRMTKWWSSALYALITASLALLMVAGFYATDASPIATLWYARLSAISVLVALVCLYFLVQELTVKPHLDTGEKAIRAGVFWAGLVIFGLSLTPAVFSEVYNVTGVGQFIDVAWGVVAYLLYVISVFVLIGRTCIKEARDAYRRRFGVIDMRFVVVRTMSYILTLIWVALLFCLTAFVLTIVFARDAVADGSAVFGPVAITSALVAALALQPLKRFFNRFTDKLLYTDNYSLDDFSVQVSQTLNSTNDLRLLLERTAALIASTIKTSQAFFFVNLLEEGRYMTAGTERHSRVTLAEFAGIQAHSEPNTPTVISQFDRDHPLHRMMVSHRLGLVMPLHKNDTIVGFLCLGQPRGVGYTNRDLHALRMVADELTIAIQNALSVEEVRKLNDTLEQRVNSATHELRTSNAQLQRLDEAKDEFISMASHQLRTPLTSIKGYLSMLIEGDVGEVTKEQKHMLSEAFVSSERMVRLIGDFLNVSRLQTGKFIIEKHPVDLAKLVQREIDGLAQNAAGRGMTFTYTKPKNIPILELDENKIQQVVMNFADNAIYYSKEHAKITISLKKVGDFVEFRVTDTGIGVPKSEQANLFNKFFRATNARRARPDGTGVGLFLAKKVIDEHHGSIIFESKEGKGSTFGFRLPIPKQ
jgi:signal transduction histidine kinase